MSMVELAQIQGQLHKKLGVSQRAFPMRVAAMGKHHARHEHVRALAS